MVKSRPFYFNKFNFYLNTTEQRDGVDRRRREAPTKITALRIVERLLKQRSSDSSSMRKEDRTNGEIRMKIKDILDVAYVDNVGSFEFVDKLVANQYDGAVETLKLGGNPLYDPENPNERDIPPPSQESVRSILIRSLTSEQLNVILGMKEPVLLLVPITSMGRYKKFANGYKRIKEQRGTRFDRIDQHYFPPIEDIKGWKVVVVEGVDNPALHYTEKCKKTIGRKEGSFYQKYKTKGAFGINIKTGICLMMDSIRKGRPISDVHGEGGTITVLNEEKNKGVFPCMNWDRRSNSINFNNRTENDPTDDVRWRPSVEVNIADYSDITHSQTRRRRAPSMEIAAIMQALRASSNHIITVEKLYKYDSLRKHNLVRLDDFKNTGLRRRVEAILKIPMNDYFYDDGKEEYIDEVTDTQYQGAIETLQLGTSPLYDPEKPKEGDVPAPTLERVKEILSTQITLEEYRVIRKMNKAVLQLIPPNRSMDNYFKYLDGFRPMKEQEVGFYTKESQGIMPAIDRRDELIKHWRIAITDGGKSPANFVDGSRMNPLRERDASFKEEVCHDGISGADLKRSIILMMDSLKSGDPISVYGEDDSTLVNEDIEMTGRFFILDYYTDDKRINLYDEEPEQEELDNSDFRTSIVKEVL